MSEDLENPTKIISHSHHAPLSRQDLVSRVNIIVPPNTPTEVPANVADGLAASFGDLVTIHESAPDKPADSKPSPVATEAAIAAAKEAGIDISTIVGSGQDGKVTKPDVDAEIERLAAAKAAGNAGNE